LYLDEFLFVLVRVLEHWDLHWSGPIGDKPRIGVGICPVANLDALHDDRFFFQEVGRGLPDVMALNTNGAVLTEQG
jgi:hypothetical protein